MTPALLMNDLYIHGEIITNKTEAGNALAGMELDPDIESIVDDLFRLTNEPLQEAQRWLTVELVAAHPAAAAVIDFLPGQEEPELKPLTEAPAAATDLIQFAGHRIADQLDDHFLFHEHGITINQDNPPTIDHSYEIVRRILGVKDAAVALDSRSTWWLGNIASILENYHGEDFNLTQVMEQTGAAYNTVVVARAVFEAFRDHRYNLPFTHHREVYYTKIPDRPGMTTDEAKREVLQLAEFHRLTAKETRKLASYAKNIGLDPLTQEIREDKDELLERVHMRDATKSFIFQHNDRWYKMRGAITDVPAGSDPVFDSQSMRQLDLGRPNFDPHELPAWQRVPAPDAT